MRRLWLIVMLTCIALPVSKAQDSIPWSTGIVESTPNYLLCPKVPGDDAYCVITLPGVTWTWASEGYDIELLEYKEPKTHHIYINEEVLRYRYVASPQDDDDK